MKDEFSITVSVEKSEEPDTWIIEFEIPDGHGLSYSGRFLTDSAERPENDEISA